jgi:uncharacterized repeat protein (TIGR01451 family)
MKTTIKHLSSALAIAALLAVPAMRVQAHTQEAWNERYRTSYEVPLGNYTGNSPFMRGMAKPQPKPAPVVQPAPAPAPKPAPAPAPAPAPRPELSSAETSCGGLVKLQKTAPSVVAVGETFTYTLNAVALCDIAETVVTDHLPAGVSYVSSEPAAEVSGNKLTWNLGNLNRNEARSLKVTVKANAKGDLVNCATVHALPRVCVTTMVGEAKLAITKTGPATALLNSDVTYNVTVSNTGNITARNVVLTDPVPAGLSGSPVTINIGDLAAGASRTVPVTFKAAQRGKACNVATADSSNAGKVSAEACTVVQQPGLKITKTTDDKSLLINRTATYAIKVQNTGDTTLTGVVVTDTAAAGTTITEAPGGSISGNTATWNIGELAAGASRDLTVKILSREPGNFCNTATVTSAQGLRDSSQACTEWIGVTGVLVEVVDDPDPIQVGESTTFTIRVTNQGSTRDLKDIAVRAKFEDEMDPVSASNNATISGKNITFPTVATLAPKASVTYTIRGKAIKAGDHRLDVEVTTKDRERPITELESTTVY